MHLSADDALVDHAKGFEIVLDRIYENRAKIDDLQWKATILSFLVAILLGLTLANYVIAGLLGARQEILENRETLPLPQRTHQTQTQPESHTQFSVLVSCRGGEIPCSLLPKVPMLVT